MNSISKKTFLSPSDNGTIIPDVTVQLVCSFNLVNGLEVERWKIISYKHLHIPNGHVTGYKPQQLVLSWSGVVGEVAMVDQVCVVWEGVGGPECKFWSQGLALKRGIWGLDADQPQPAGLHYGFLRCTCTCRY